MKNNRTFSYYDKISRRNTYSKINVSKISNPLLINLIFTFIILSIFPLNVVSSDLICQKTNKKSKDSVKKSKEFIEDLPAIDTPNKNKNKTQPTIWLDPYTKYSSLPEPDDFIDVSQEPGVDLKELQKHIVYPKQARRAKIEGRVILRVLVDKNGDILKVTRETSDSDLLTQAALDAVLKTKFTPAYINKKPVACWVSVPINFKLKKY